MQRYIIWIEGLEPKNGEKIKAIKEDGVTYTCSMGNAMRIRECDISKMKEYMKKHHFAEWVINGHYTFIKTSYTPKGTLYKFPKK